MQVAQLLERYWLQHTPQALLAAASAAPVAPPRSRRKAAARPDEAPPPQQPLQPPLQQQQQEAAAAYQVTNTTWLRAALALLPYELTADQHTVLAEVLEDMRSPRAMLRLLQGDVGCGKTVVALMACLAAAGSGARACTAVAAARRVPRAACVDPPHAPASATPAAGFQALMLAPTELLANQHYATLSQIAEQLTLRNQVRAPHACMRMHTHAARTRTHTRAHACMRPYCIAVLSLAPAPATLALCAILAWCECVLSAPTIIAGAHPSARGAADEQHQGA